MNMSRVPFYKTPIGCGKQDENSRLLSPKLEGEGRCEGKKPGRKEEEAFNKGKKPPDISMLTTSNLVSPRLSKSATM